MGYWCTLHLFDEKKFYKAIVPELKGEAGDLNNVCLEFLKFHIPGGVSHLPAQKINNLIEHNINRIISISNSLDNAFKTHCEFKKIKDYNSKSLFLNNLDGYYDYCKFFEYYVFKTCADFFPHLPLGKGGVSQNFDLDVKTLSYTILGELDYWNEFLCWDATGITNWITNESIDFLYFDKENLQFGNNELATGFLTMLDIAHKNRLGFVMGVDIREDRLELLPKSKLVSIDVWVDKALNGLLFKR